MIALQVISKILTTGSNELVEDNLLDESYFTGYLKRIKYTGKHKLAFLS